jgi:hypothetical protein
MTATARRRRRSEDAGSLPPAGYGLLLESGGFLLLETGDRMVLESDAPISLDTP